MQIAFENWAVVIVLVFICTLVIGIEASAANFGYETKYWVTVLITNGVQSVALAGFTVDALLNASVMDQTNVYGIALAVILTLAQMIAFGRHWHQYRILNSYYDIGQQSLSQQAYDHAVKHVRPYYSDAKDTRANRMRTYLEMSPLTWF